MSEKDLRHLEHVAEFLPRDHPVQDSLKVLRAALASRDEIATAAKDFWVRAVEMIENEFGIGAVTVNDAARDTVWGEIEAASARLVEALTKVCPVVFLKEPK